MPKFNSHKRRGALTRFEAAMYLGISIRSLDNLLSAGEIPKVKIGRKTVVRVDDLDNFLNRKKAQQ